MKNLENFTIFQIKNYFNKYYEKKNKLKKKKLEDVKIIKTKIFNDNRVGNLIKFFQMNYIHF